jgi:16S rRNA G966 N2-methylase RsmD
MPGDKVLDAFGCSGGMCQEAIALNRDYLYIESNDTNYNLGLTNIRDELIKQGLIDEKT